MQQLDEIIGGSSADAPAKFKRMSLAVDAADETQISSQRAPTPTLLVGSHSATSSSDTRTTCFNNRRLRGSAMVSARDCFDPVSSNGSSGRISSSNNDGTESLQANAKAVAELFGSAYDDDDDDDDDDNNDNDTDKNDNDNINNDNEKNDSDDNDDDDVCHPCEEGMDKHTRDDTTDDKISGLNSSIREFSMRRLRPTKELLRRRLRKFDSMFFRDNPISRVPRFNPEELDLGEHLGSGNYGDVYEIESLAMKPNRISNLTIILEKDQSDFHFIGEEDDEESQPEDGDDDGPLTASLTLPIPDDLLVGGGDLDHYLRRRYALVQEQENDEIPSAILDENTNHSNKNNCHDNSEQKECCHQQFIDDNNGSDESGDSSGVMPGPKPNRRSALNLKDRKAQMVKRQMSSKNLERYAVKVVRDDIASERKKRLATADIITEARILAALSHPSIIRLRGIMGYAELPGKYGIIIDKLESTLHKEISKWAEVASKQKIDLNCPQRASLFESVPPWMLIRQESKLKRRMYIERARFFLDRLKAASGVAQAMKYLHEKKIVFRDLKPENVGVSKGTYVLFDFGLSRYLTDDDRVAGNRDDQYYATGLTGSRIFMAPEVARNKPYGFSADVFSFAILFWEVMSLQEVFPSMNVSKHFRCVIIKGRRPASIANLLTQELNDMMKDSWAANPLKRPSFDSICQTLTRIVREVELSIRQKTSSLPNFQSIIGSSLEGFKPSRLGDFGSIAYNCDSGDEKCTNNKLLSPRSIFRKMKAR